MIHDASVQTDVGYVREHNEDDALLLPGHGVYAVADGMGGHAFGEVASRIAVASIAAFYEDADSAATLRSAYRAARRDQALPRALSFARFRLEAALEYANHQIFLEATGDARYTDMGTTIVVVAFLGARVYVAHVGDSRIYRLRRTTLQPLTEDHSLANQLIRAKRLRPEDLPRFRYKNVIVRALGLRPSVPIDTWYRTCRDGDRYLLCTDGLTDLVSDADIRKILRATPGAAPAAKRLVARALDAGGLDNVTVMVIDIHP